MTFHISKLQAVKKKKKNIKQYTKIPPQSTSKLDILDYFNTVMIKPK